MISFFYVILAILGLSFLIFIHELGHYWMARRVGMRVEVFSIGFGKPLYVWERKGVKWQIGWLLFGGYVKIAGMETEKDVDPHTISDGFFGKSPWQRIKVAFMGPFVNCVFAFLVFGLIWCMGGREKNFMEFTKIIGWVDPHSELYALGIRPGDEVSSLNGMAYQNSKDLVFAAMIASGDVAVRGYKINYATGNKTPFDYAVAPYRYQQTIGKGPKTLGIISPANYVIYNRLPNGSPNPLPEGSPLIGSGIQYGDRVLWVDGQPIFSSTELDALLNDGRVLLTVQRGSETLLRRVPRVHAQELKLEHAFKDELLDWQFEAGLKGKKLQKLYVIPYNLTNESIVESQAKFIDSEKHDEAFPKHLFSSDDQSLLPGDKILAVDGAPVQKSSQLLKQLQVHYVNVIVQRDLSAIQKISWRHEDESFEKSIDYKSLQKIAESIGTGAPVKAAGDLVLLNPIVPKPLKALALSAKAESILEAEISEKKREIENIEDPERRAQAMHLLEKSEKQLLLGLPYVQDRKVNYNPLPTSMFENVFQEIWRTLGALLTGAVSVNLLSGPVGIVQIVTDNWMVSAKEGLFWIAAISLNLAVINLLPIPVLDGGTILISFLEMVTRRRLSPKTLEKIILPFALLLIIFFLYLTYHDISRLLGGVWR